MGIDIASLVGQARHAMFQAGLVPHELHAVAERAALEGSFQAWRDAGHPVEP
ncbi:MAG: hypothetical protein HGA45_44850, partial [Chloroflexales bacterium]|nr:hypothetical protein [Chloroflexales bacterium]